MKNYNTKDLLNNLISASVIFFAVVITSCNNFQTSHNVTLEEYDDKTKSMLSEIANKSKYKSFVNINEPRIKDRVGKMRQILQQNPKYYAEIDFDNLAEIILCHCNIEKLYLTDKNTECITILMAGKYISELVLRYSATNADNIISNQIQKSGYKKIDFFNDGVGKNNNYLFAKENNQSLILNIMHNPQSNFYLSDKNWLKLFFSTETDAFLPDWDIKDPSLVTLADKVKNDSYEGIILLELIINKLYKEAYWRITGSSDQQKKTIEWIKSIEKNLDNN